MRARTLLILPLFLIAACSAEPGPVRTPPPPSPSWSALGSPAAPTPAVEKRAAPAESLKIATRQAKFQRGSDRPLPTTVWYPTEGERPFPLIVFGHGLTSEPAAYAVILRAWARAGFVVAAPTFPYTSHRTKKLNPVDVFNQPADVSEVITGMLAADSDGLIDRDRIAAAGHSAGGITTVGLFTANRDDRLKAGVVLSGRIGVNVPFTGDPVPMLFVHGKLDKTVPYADGLAVFNEVPWPKAMMAVTKGGHVALTKDFEPVIATTTDFLRYALYGDAAARKRLPADARKGNRATLIDKL